MFDFFLSVLYFVPFLWFELPEVPFLLFFIDINLKKHENEII